MVQPPATLQSIYRFQAQRFSLVAAVCCARKCRLGKGLSLRRATGATSESSSRSHTGQIATLLNLTEPLQNTGLQILWFGYYFIM